MLPATAGAGIAAMPASKRDSKQQRVEVIGQDHSSSENTPTKTATRVAPDKLHFVGFVTDSAARGSGNRVASKAGRFGMRAHHPASHDTQQTLLEIRAALNKP